MKSFHERTANICHTKLFQETGHVWISSNVFRNIHSHEILYTCLDDWIPKENIWKLPISGIGCQQCDGRHTSHCHRTDNIAKGFFWAHKLLKTNHLPICYEKKSEWTKKLSPRPQIERCFILSFFFASVLKSVPRYLWARCTDICIGKLTERVLAPAWRTLSTQTEWHTGTQMDLQRGKGWNTCFFICQFYFLLPARRCEI